MPRATCHARSKPTTSTHGPPPTSGFPEIPLMEDVAMSKRLKRVSRPLCLTARVVTSGRRWQEHGVIRTVLLMWQLRLAYFFGAEPAALARRYGYGPRDG
jgi:hypothetical protein